MINDEIEKWYFNTYQNLRSLGGYEHHLSITDFKHYFDIYPIPFKKTSVISIIKKIDISINKYQKEIEDSKSNNAVKKV